MRRRRDAGARAATVCDSAGIYFGGRRRFRRVDLDLDPPVLRVVVRIGRIGRAVPADARRRELVRLQRRELPDDRFLHRVRAVQRQLLHQALRHLALHRAVGVPFDDDARRAVLAGELADFLDDEADVRIVELLDVLAVRRCA